MASCPNVNLEEWKTLENAVGKFEAYKDFMETNGEIRSPEVVQNKIDARKNEVPQSSEFSSEPSIAELANKTVNDATKPLTVDSLKRTRAGELADKMTRALGVEYEYITPDQATDITKDAKNPWSGQPAFFFGGRVYLLEGRLSTENVFHEFSHPVVRHLSKLNTELFDNLFDEVMATEEAAGLVNEVEKQYPFLTIDDTLFKEELIVKALTKHGVEKINRGKFAKAIANILYYIKQAMRKVFGRDISISKLNTNTTVDQLAEILTQGDTMTVETEVVSEEDVVAYNKENFEAISEDISGIEPKQLQDITNMVYDTVSQHIQQLYSDRNYDRLVDVLKDEFKRGDLQEIKSNLSKYQTTIKSAVEDYSDNVQNLKGKSVALTDSLIRLDSIGEKMYEHLKDIQEEGDTQENMNKAYYYEKFIKHYEGLIEELDKAMRLNRVSNSSPIRQVVSSIKANMENARDVIKELQADGSRDALFEQLEPLSRNVSERYEEIISNLKKKNAPQERIDKVFREYHGMNEAEYGRFKEYSSAKKERTLTAKEQADFAQLTQKSRDGLSVTKDKIEALLKGEAGDANWFNSYLEGYLYNSDPIVGGLALYTKNALNEVMIVAQKKYNTFAEELREPLKEAGFNPSMLGRLGERTTFTDTVGVFNPETGKLEAKEVKTFLNKFKGHRFAKAKMNESVQDAHDRYLSTNNEEDKKVFLEAVEARKKFERDYFHQQYVDRFYEHEELLTKDDIGKEAAYMRGEIFERMRMLTESNRSQTDDIAIQDELDVLWREYAQMYSRYYTNGKLKTGRDAQIAERLREFKEASREFYEWKPRTGVFENQYFDFLQELRGKNIDEGSLEWDSKIEAWKAANSRVVIKPEFYENRNRILNEVKEILDKLPANERKEIDQTAIWEEILELTAGMKDQDDQVNANEMSQNAVARVKELQEKLEEIKLLGVQRSGLTREQQADRSRLYEKQREEGLTPTESDTLRKLNNLAKTQGLSKVDSNKLNNLYAELAELTSKSATTHYVDQVNDILGGIDLSGTKFMKDYNIKNVDQLSANWLLNKEVVDELSALSPEFAEWHSKNHIAKEKWNSETKSMEPTFERLYVWSVSKPSNANMYESFDIKDSLGNVVDTVQGVPSLKYFTRSVKPEFRNRNIPGVTKDNQGNWLPKTLEDGAKDDQFINQDYEKMRNSTDPQEQALFRVLELMKKYHLNNQEGLSYSNRLGFDVPRYRKDNLEIVRGLANDPMKKGREKLTGLTILMQRIKDFFQKTADQAEDGMSYENNFNLVRADMFDNEMTDIPISGLYDINVDDVTMDVTTSINRYMLSAERQKQLVKFSPVVRAIQNTVNHPDNAIKDINRVNKQNFIARNITKYLDKDKNVRAQAVNNWVEKHFEGKTQKGLGADAAFLNNFANLLFKRASFTFFALNIPSAIKNSLGMKFQEMIEASGGKYVDHVTLQKGNAWAYKAMGQLSFTNQLYTRGAKTHNLQMVEIFDPIQDRFEDKFGEGISRTLAKDAAGMSWLYSFRKWVEIQAGLQLFGGMMYKKKIKMGDKEISYMDAFETVDNQIRLKKGIDVRYGTEPVIHVVKEGDTVDSIAKQYNIAAEDIEKVTGLTEEAINLKKEKTEDIELDRELDIEEVGLEELETEEAKTRALDTIAAINKKYDARLAEQGTIKINNSEFKFMKNQIQMVTNNMGGAYAKFDQPEAQRYLAFRWISYLRRYFTAMAVNRWGFRGKLLDPQPRLNPGSGDFQKGFYIQFFQTMIDTVKSMGGNLQYATKEEKVAALKFGSEVAYLLAITGLMSLLFGWDPDDDDRLNKLRAMSGSFPTPFGSDDGRPDFDLMGYMELHSLHMLMQVRAENEQFNLLTGGFKPYISLLDWKSVAASPTLDTYGTIWGDIKGMYTGSEKAYYSRDIGPYSWQKKGSAKFYNHFAKMVGITGTTVDPALAIQNFQSFYVRSNK